MRYLFGLIMLLCSVPTYSQIKTLEVIKDTVPAAKRAVGIYDGTINYLPDEDFEQYIGQVFYMPKTTEESYKIRQLYIKNPKKSKKKPLLDGKCFWDAMGKYYEVVGVEDIERFNTADRYILLKDKESGIIYYYWATWYDRSKRGFPFIVVSYFEKTREKIIGDTIHFDGFKIQMFNVHKDKFSLTAQTSILPFVCTDYVIDEQQTKWNEIIFMQNGDSLQIKLPLSWALSFHSTDAEVANFIRKKKELRESDARHAEYARQEKEKIEKIFSEARELIGTTIYPFNYSGDCFTATSIDAKKEGERVEFEINTPLKVVHVGVDEDDKYHAMLYFTNAEGKLFMRSFTFDTPDLYYFHDAFSTVDLRKKHKNISQSTWNQIKKGRAVIGMTKAECELAEGSPDSVSSTNTANGSTTIWRYSIRYLYFVNGRLTATGYY